jgi:apolipoprotein N-acyltransferase
VWKAVLLSLLSGGLLTVGFPRIEAPWASWAALLPLFFALRGKSARQALLLGYVCGMAHYLTTIYWIKYVVNYYGGLPLAVAVLLLVLLCGYLALYPAAFALAANRWEGRPRLWSIGLPTVWVALEWVRAHALTGFPWALLGYTQTSFTPLAQIADITGVYGVSWLVVFGNTCIMNYCSRRRLHGMTAVFAACLVSALVYGHWRMESIRKMEDAVPPLEAGVLQGNVEQSVKWSPEFQGETLERYRRLSLDAMRSPVPPKLLVWPETAAPFLYGIDPVLTGQLNEIVATTDVPTLFGSPAAKRGQDGGIEFYNRAYLVDADARLLGAYDKQHLVPFGEYVPLREILFFVERLVETAGDTSPGGDPSPLSLDGQKLGILICYEDVFPALARQTVRRGANILVNITNDAWYGVSSAPYQHAQMASWRCIECRTPMLRAANTGVSAIYDALGQACGSVKLNEQGFLVCPVRPLGLETFYTGWGDVFAWGCTLASLGLVLLAMRGRGPRGSLA